MKTPPGIIKVNKTHLQQVKAGTQDKVTSLIISKLKLNLLNPEQDKDTEAMSDKEIHQLGENQRGGMVLAPLADNMDLTLLQV